MRTEYLGISKSCIEPMLCFNRILIPTKNIDIVLFAAHGQDSSCGMCDGIVETVSLYTNNGCYDLDRFSFIVDNAIESDFTDLYGMSFYAIIEKDVLQKVCDAESLSIRVTQKNYVFSFDDKKKYYMSPYMNAPSRVTTLTYFRAAYNSFCDKTAWPECEKMVQYNFIQRLIGY